MKDDIDSHPQRVVDALNSEHSSASDYELKRLAEARMSALAKVPERPHTGDNITRAFTAKWLSALSVASMLIAGILVLNMGSGDRSLPGSELVFAVEEVESIMSSEDLNFMTEDLEFYEWLDNELESVSAES